MNMTDYAAIACAIADERAQYLPFPAGPISKTLDRMSIRLAREFSTKDQHFDAERFLVMCNVRDARSF